MKAILCSIFLVVTSLLAAAKTSAVIESWDQRMVVTSLKKLTVTESIRIHVLEEDGYRFAIYNDYYNWSRKIKSISYVVYDQSGKKVKKLTKADALDIKVSASYEITDARIMYIDPEYRIFPFTIEIETEIEYNGFLGFPEWMPRFYYNLEVKQASLTLEHDATFKYNVWQSSMAPQPIKSEQAGHRIVRWSVSNLVAVEEHSSYKNFARDQVKVEIAPYDFDLELPGTFKSWATFGDWFLDLNKGRSEIGVVTKSYLDSLKIASSDQHDLVRAVYKFMQKKTRYISIQLRIGGFQTIPASKVEATGYGDCKALTNYMKGMLEYLQIPSHYILVHAGRDVPDINSDFPSNQFNHVFLGVPFAQDTLLFECTSQLSPPAYIGSFTDDRNVLWITRSRSKIIRSPLFTADKSVRQTECKVELEKTGDALFTIKTKQQGFFYDEVNAYQHMKKDRIEEMNYSKFHYKDFTIRSFNFSIPDPSVPELKLDYVLKVNNLAKSIGDKMALPVNLLTPLEKEFDLDALNRKVEVQRAFTVSDKVHLLLPPDFYISFKPDEFHLESEFGSVDMKLTPVGENEITLERKAVIRKGFYSGETFTKFQDMLKKIKVFEQSSVVFRSKT